MATVRWRRACVRPDAVSERVPDLLSNRITSQRRCRMIDKSPMIRESGWLESTRSCLVLVVWTSSVYCAYTADARNRLTTSAF
jgi:hypothetical protein